LPYRTRSASYALEYGQATIEVHDDAFTAGDRVLVVDDVLATGGTVEAAVGLVTGAGAEVVAVSVLMELGFLAGRNRLRGIDLHALLRV
jgi:adenine phosphoribosyltransferase